MRSFETPADLPGQTPVSWHKSPGRIVAAAVLGAAWPPLILTLIPWPPQNWQPGSDIDWRLLVLAIGAVAVPSGLWFLARERERTGRPGSRLGVVWRFMFYGGLLAAALQGLLALSISIFGWFEAGGAVQAAGATETTLLIYGVAGLPVAILVGVSYALWAGLCVAFVAFRSRPPVRDRLGVMGTGAEPEA
ncbi:phthalate transporter [uncultured Brevundimonas sp.]|uniref:phthalate transporter n=1 Tax=uncultured Brevundimonas sp. TaxID=213418 RepID=UPI0030EF360B|tara:strand:- start:43694 stop:44266 length:573 start_codon:yes stop_codon:yes gene_type:complete